MENSHLAPTKYDRGMRTSNLLRFLDQCRLTAEVHLVDARRLRRGVAGEQLGETVVVAAGAERWWQVLAHEVGHVEQDREGWGYAEDLVDVQRQEQDADQRAFRMLKRFALSTTGLVRDSNLSLLWHAAKEGVVDAGPPRNLERWLPLGRAALRPRSSEIQILFDEGWL